jgi:hypothetical protein
MEEQNFTLLKIIFQYKIILELNQMVRILTRSGTKLGDSLRLKVGAGGHRRYSNFLDDFAG